MKNHQSRSMRPPKMSKTALLATIFLFAITAQSHDQRTLYQDHAHSGEIWRRARSIDEKNAENSIMEVLRRISKGGSSEADDEELAKLIKEEIVETAKKIKTPAGSIEAAAERAQKLVSELTTAYTTAIYKSKSGEDARRNFARFQNTIQNIVDYVKAGKFVI